VDGCELSMQWTGNRALCGEGCVRPRYGRSEKGRSEIGYIIGVVILESPLMTQYLIDQASDPIDKLVHQVEAIATATVVYHELKFG